MSKTRHDVMFDPRAKAHCPITTLTYDYPRGYVVPEHRHDRAQLVFASEGVMTVHTRDGTWVVPTQRAVWVPAHVPHSIVMSGAVSMRTLDLSREAARGAPKRCRVVNVSPLLRELIVHACRTPGLSTRVKAQAHLVSVIVDQIRSLEAVPILLPRLKDARLKRIEERLRDDPSSRETIREVCREAGIASRTAQRLVLRETGMKFGQWRQQLRLIRALQLLAEGHKIIHVALEAGYSSPSAFVSMFRKALGTTPSAYFRSESRGAAAGQRRRKS